MNKADLRKLLGKRIREMRHVFNISREELAEILDISVSSLGLIERGERGVTLLNLIKVSDTFGISIDKILLREQKTPSAKI